MPRWGRQARGSSFVLDQPPMPSRAALGLSNPTLGATGARDGLFDRGGPGCARPSMLLHPLASKHWTSCSHSLQEPLMGVGGCQMAAASHSPLCLPYSPWMEQSCPQNDAFCRTADQNWKYKQNLIEREASYDKENSRSSSHLCLQCQKWVKLVCNGGICLENYLREEKASKW